MSVFKEIYEGVKELLAVAKKIKNQQLIELANDLQAKFFELKEENESVKDINKRLITEIENLKKPVLKEEDISYNSRGFFVETNATPKIPYCSACWKRDRLLVPLSQVKNWWQFKCSSCKTEVIVMTSNGKEINE